MRRYSGDNIKLDLLNTYYMSFNQRLQTVIEEKLLKPIAMRKGFVAVDDWGNPTLLYPKLSFSRLGLKDANILETLFELYQKNVIPADVIFDVLNLDTEQMRRGVELTPPLISLPTEVRQAVLPDPNLGLV